VIHTKADGIENDPDLAGFSFQKELQKLIIFEFLILNSLNR